MDADGLAILNQYREAGLNVVSILMDIATYNTYAKFGTNTDIDRDPINASRRRGLTELTS